MKKLIIVLLSASLMQVAFSQSGTNEESAKRFENRKTKGNYSIAQIGMLMGHLKLTEQPYNNNYPRSIQVVPSVTMTKGVMFNEKWAAGLGFGFEIFEYNMIPLFFDFRHTRRDNDVSPFFALKIGYSLGSRKKHYDNLYLSHPPYSISDAYFKNHGGFLCHPEIGVKIPYSDNADVQFTIAYRYQKMKTTVSQETGQRPKWDYETSMNRISFGMAIMFR